MIGVVFIVGTSRAGGHLHGQHVVGGESRRHALQAHEAANQQSGADQQHQRKSEFGNDQQAAQTVPPQVQAAVALSAAPAGLQRSIEIHLDRAPRRRHAEQDASHQRKAEA